MDDCIFCKIAKGQAPAKIEMENSKIISFASISPAAEHHILIVPKIHIASFTDLGEKHKDIFMGMVKMAQDLIKAKKISSGYKLVFNGGKYQYVKHLHWHLLAGNLENEDDVLNKT